MRWNFILLTILLNVYLQSESAERFGKQDSTYSNSPDSIANGNHHDTIPNGVQQESDFQNYLDTLYHNDNFTGVDTFAWDTKMINSGHFNSKDMNDTLRIVLVDSLKCQYYTHPFRNYITCGFGQRRWLWHYGMDIKLNKGDSVYAAFDGVVRVTKFDYRGFGWVVVIRHPSGLETIYGHLMKILLEPNQKVRAGDLVGLGGSTGRSTGSHLHFETRFRGEPFDPNCFIDFNTYMLKSDTLILSKNNFEYLIDIRKAKYCTVRKGDTLYKIAHRYHTTISVLCKLNNISRKKLLRIGRPLRYQ
jgi:murein DD-endopeptidase MepM/ murein hydrolase activator NlpD